MRIAIFGGTGFLGYDFVRLLLEEEGGWQPIVYCSSAMNLANLRRHAVDIRLVPPAKLPGERLDPGIDTIVNFAHPFARREQLSADAQTDLFVRFLAAAREQNEKLKLVHLSTMSVYEPFAAAREFGEADPLHPPAGDSYATAKLYAERGIRRLPDAAQWQLILRPTIVYGPYCRPWTDGPMQAFAQGDVAHDGLSGRIQPVWGRDVSRVIRHALDDFRPGILNVAGNETVTWMDFLGMFRDVVGRGRLIELPAAPGGAGHARAPGFHAQHLGTLFRDTVRHPSFLALAARMARPFPRPFVMKVWQALGGDRRATAIDPESHPAPSLELRFAQPFFSEDRLVSRVRFADRHPGFRLTPLRDVRDVLRDYYEYRFTDRLFTGVIPA